jgi:intergrase/recombinase
MCYARRYASVLIGEQLTNLLQLPPQTRLNVMKALTALSKYLGCYETWKKTIKQYNLHWTTGSESMQALQRFFDTNSTLESMLQRIRGMIQVLPVHMAEIVKFALITGLRPSEACESVRLLRSNQQQQQYYNPEQQCLEHFRFPETFLRPTKKAYLSYITKEMLSGIAQIGPLTPTYNAIRQAVKRRGLNMEMHLTRKVFASWLIKSGIDTTTVDILSGRAPTSVLTRHYLSPEASLRDDVLKAVHQLKERIEC